MKKEEDNPHILDVIELDENGDWKYTEEYSDSVSKNPDQSSSNTSVILIALAGAIILTQAIRKHPKPKNRQLKKLQKTKLNGRNSKNA